MKSVCLLDKQRQLSDILVVIVRKCLFFHTFPISILCISTILLFTSFKLLQRKKLIEPTKFNIDITLMDNWKRAESSTTISFQIIALKYCGRQHYLTCRSLPVSSARLIAIADRGITNTSHRNSMNHFTEWNWVWMTKITFSPFNNIWNKPLPLVECHM